MDIEFHEIILYTLPSLFLPLFFDAGIDYIKKTHRYRLNDTITNLSISLANLGASFIILTAVLAVYSYTYSNFSQFQLNQTELSTWLLAFILYDFCYYWNHRLHHKIGILWADHIVHHSGEEMNFGVSIRQSFLTELTMWPLFLLMALVGISIEVFLITSYIQATWAFLIHTKCLKNTRWLDNILNTPSLHRVHHATNQMYIDKNFGGILVVWDQIFGTYQNELADSPVKYGIMESFASFSPVSINLQYYKVILKKIAYSHSISEMLKSIFASPGWVPKAISAKKFYAEISNLSARQHVSSRGEISVNARKSCIIRFILTLSVFILLMWNFALLGWWQIANLAVLFFWLCHYNGLAFDGVKLTWKIEAISQFLIILVGGVVVYNNQPGHLLILVLIASITSLSCYIVYQNPPIKPETDALTKALVE
ncbi:sterol desaturase family protein [Spartinivicinus ruber]|uniref:sterol desaturase family protein n=1 Tax=Spartinivicinus ruber TaxID=2683272 RepID=UPI0013D08857|nr:sterol desaturase family protein [Spartinivicinus ruber]